MISVQKYGEELILEFKYNPLTINIIKEIPGRRWNPSRMAWLVPANQWRELIKRFPNLENSEAIQNILTEEKQKQKELEQRAKEYSDKIRKEYPAMKEYQRVAVGEILQNHTFGLFDDMGLGKTFVSLAVIDILIRNKSIDKALIVCKNRNKGTWGDPDPTYGEAAKWVPRLKVQILKRQTPVDKTAQILIINYENIWTRREEFCKLLQSEKVYLLFDEAHHIGSHKAQMTKAALRIAKYAQEVMPITGTPMRDKVENVWPILKLLEPDCENFTAFKNKYCELERMSFGGRVFDKIVGYQNLSELRERIMSKAIRRTKEQVLDLPEKRFSYLTCELSGEQRKLYRDVEKAVMVELEVVNDANLVIHATHILGRMIRLMQITSDPGVLTGNFGSAKLTVLDELINDLYSEYPDRKVIIWSNWINMINYLERHIQEEHGIGSIAIHGQVRNFEKRLKSFKTDKDCKILICNPKIGGEGLNLTVANTNIYFDRNFSLQMWKQSQDRVHRAGQKLNCMNYILYAENTIDELINTTLLQKEKMGCDISGGDFTKLDSIKAFVKFMRGRK